MNQFRFTSEEGVPCTGQIVKKIGPALIIEGMAADSGSHFLKVDATTRRFASRKEAEDYATELASDAKDCDLEGDATIGNVLASKGKFSPLDHDAGAVAFKAGKPITSNPHHPVSAKSNHESWNMGWNFAKNKLGKDAPTKEDLKAFHDFEHGTKIKPGHGPDLTSRDPEERRRKMLAYAREGWKRYPGSRDAKLATDPSVSAAQHRAMGAAAGGHSNLGIPKKVGKEFMKADKGKGFDASVDPMEKLIDEHEKEAKRKRAEIYNFGSGQSDTAIGSKTSKGWLESSIDPKTLRVTHNWQ